MHDTPKQPMKYETQGYIVILVHVLRCWNKQTEQQRATLSDRKREGDRQKRGHVQGRLSRKRKKRRQTKGESIVHDTEGYRYTVAMGRP
jgi:hypothetical protein